MVQQHPRCAEAQTSGYEVQAQDPSLQSHVVSGSPSAAGRGSGNSLVSDMMIQPDVGERALLCHQAEMAPVGKGSLSGPWDAAGCGDHNSIFICHQRSRLCTWSKQERQGTSTPKETSQHGLEVKSSATKDIRPWGCCNKGKHKQVQHQREEE